ncbi:MAG TPA: NAD(P)/FAD-dependent oxidoreductase [Jiangellaceae bacterium]|nr:NAD(P)/FAD-dependent oxidoreductase [Jiangellaceae bacterium]
MTAMVDADVIVAGGGPVGLATAIEARLAGLSVIVCEPRPGPIDKACGEGLMPGTLTALGRLGAHVDGFAFTGIRYVADGSIADHRFRAGPGLGVRRTSLHRALAARARELGVDFAPARVAEISQDADAVAAAGLRARWLLACDGLHSRIRQELGLDRTVRNSRRFGLRRHFRVAPWSEFVEVHWTPSAEVYITPVGHDLVGVAVLGDRGVDYDAVVRLTAAGHRLADADRASTLRGAGPLRQAATKRVAGRVLLVGDSAGYVDALTGEGIRLGLAQARAAVAAVAGENPARYEAEWRRITRDYRLLTSALVGAGRRPALRSRIVPLACRLPRVYGAIVDRLAG